MAKKKIVVEETAVPPETELRDPIVENGEVAGSVVESPGVWVTDPSAIGYPMNTIPVEWIGGLRFTDGLYTYQLDERKRGEFTLRIVGAV